MSKPTVLIADDDTSLAEAISLRCRSMGLNTVISPDGLHAYGVITQNPPDLLILDMNMPGANGLYMCEDLSCDVRFAPIPVILLTGESNEDTIRRCEQLGAHYVWKGLDTWEKLKPLVSKLLGLPSDEPGPASRATETPVPQSTTETTDPHPDRPKLLVVDDDQDICRTIRIRLQTCGIQVLTACSAMQGYWTALKEEPDVITIDYSMPEGHGSYLLGRLKNHPLTQHIPVIVVTGQKYGFGPDHALQREMFNLGAVAYLTKPVDYRDLIKELSQYITIDQAQLPRVLQTVDNH